MLRAASYESLSGSLAKSETSTRRKRRTESKKGKQREDASGVELERCVSD